MTDWPTTTIGDLFDIGSGKTMSSKVRADAKPTKFLRTSNVFWDRIDLSKIDEMPMLPGEREDKALLPGDLLVCEGGEIGRAAVWEGQAEGVSFQNHLHRLRRKKDDIDPWFYVYFLQSAFTQLGIYQGAGNKTTIPNLSRSNLAALDVPKPDFDEQRDIRLVLKRVRAAIGLADSGVCVANELKCATMRKLFTQGLRGEAQKDSEIGLVPESWSVRRLGSLGKIGGGTTPNRSKSEFWDGGTIPWITSGKMYEREISNAEVHLTPRGLKANNLPLLKPGTLLIAIVGQGKTLGHCAILSIEATISRHVGYFQPDETITGSRYIRGYLESIYDYLRQLASGNGSTRAALTAAILRDIPVPVPPTLEEQAEITAVFEAINAKIDLHQRKKALLEELYRALLHKLMTCEIRVADLDLSALKDGVAV